MSRKFFKIPVSWEEYGVVRVEAETLEDALKEANRIEDEEEGFALPEGNYIDGSFKIEQDEEIIASENNMYDEEFIEKLKEKKKNHD